MANKSPAEGSNPKAEPWTESEFEEWFLENPHLPKRERVLVVARERATKREVDLVAVDKDGGLVIIEVKNERSTREAIGQSLEYLAQYADVTFADLADGYSSVSTQSLAGQLKRVFGKAWSPTMKARRRRVYLFAPSFDVHSAVCARHLSEELLGGKVAYGLVTVVRQPGGFDLKPFDCPPLVHPRKISSGFGTSPSGRVYALLVRGARPVMWDVGKEGAGGALSLLHGVKFRQRSVLQVTRPLVPTAKRPDVDLSESGRVLERRGKAGVLAKVVGRLERNDGDLVVLARFESRQFRKFQRKSSQELSAKWQASTAVLPEWPEIAAASGQRA